MNHFVNALRHNRVKDFLCESDHQTAKKGQETIRPLAGIVRLKRKANLHNTPAEQDNADSLDCRKNKRGHIIDRGQRVISRERGRQKQYHQC